MSNPPTNAPGVALKPCPFCGSPAQIVQASNDPRWWIIRCTDQADDAAQACRARPEIQEDNRELAIVHWNHREPPYATLQARVETLEKQNADLVRFVRHHGHCASRAYNFPPDGKTQGPCNCGLDAALNATPSREGA